MPSIKPRPGQGESRRRLRDSEKEQMTESGKQAKGHYFGTIHSCRPLSPRIRNDFGAYTARGLTDMGNKFATKIFPPRKRRIISSSRVPNGLDRTRR